MSCEPPWQPLWYTVISHPTRCVSLFLTSWQGEFPPPHNIPRHKTSLNDENMVFGVKLAPSHPRSRHLQTEEHAIPSPSSLPPLITPISTHPFLKVARTVASQGLDSRRGEGSTSLRKIFRGRNGVIIQMFSGESLSHCLSRIGFRSACHKYNADAKVFGRFETWVMFWLFSLIMPCYGGWPRNAFHSLSSLSFGRKGWKHEILFSLVQLQLVRLMQLVLASIRSWFRW